MFTARKLCVFVYFSLYILLKIGIFCECFNIDTRYLNRPGRNLCYQQQNVNCSNQVTSEHHRDAACLMKYLNATSSVCDESEFTGEKTFTDDYGKVFLTPYAWITGGFPFPAFNITFRNISWKRLRFRFAKVGKTTAQICREFLVSGDIESSSVISFDCLWGNGATAEELYTFQYVLTTKDDHQLLYTHLLQVPKDSDVESDIRPQNYRLFTLLEQTALPQVRMKLLVPPTRLNISRVNVSLVYQQDLSGPVSKLEEWTIDMSDKQPGDYISTGMFNTNYTVGYYYYNTSFQSSYCLAECRGSSTPQLCIPRSRRDIQVMTIIMLIASFAFALLALLILRNKYYKKIIDGPEKSPIVLFIYESSYPSHIENIYKFREFLQDNCYIESRLDLLDISKTESMNPWQWYYKTFEEANYVLVFASPNDNSKKGLHEDNVYHNLHTYALKLLIVYLLHKNKLKFSVASVKLPGCSWESLPPEAQIVEKRFSLPEQLTHMFKFLNVPPVKNGSSLLVSALQQPRIPPQFIVSRPVTPLKFPFNSEDFDLDSEEVEDGEVRDSIVIKGFPLKLDGGSTSEDDEEDDHQELSLIGLQF